MVSAWGSCISGQCPRGLFAVRLCLCGMCLLVGVTAVVRSLGIRVCVWGTIGINSGRRGAGIGFAGRARRAFWRICLRAVC